MAVSFLEMWCPAPISHSGLAWMSYIKSRKPHVLWSQLWTLEALKKSGESLAIYWTSATTTKCLTYACVFKVRIQGTAFFFLNTPSAPPLPPFYPPSPPTLYIVLSTAWHYHWWLWLCQGWKWIHCSHSIAPEAVYRSHTECHIFFIRLKRIHSWR